MRALRSAALLLAVSLLTLFAPPLHAQQAQGVIAGRVIDASSGKPLAGAQVSIPGTGLGAICNAQGQFRIEGVTGSSVTLRVQLIGYTTKNVPASPGVTDLTISLDQSAVSLERIVVTATAGGTKERALGNKIASINASEIQDASAANFSNVLHGRVTGMVVSQGTGGVGAASRIVVRGRATLSLSNAPIVYIDGVRMNSQSEGGFGEQQVSRLDDLDPADIQDVSVIKGPSAATLYGTEASNGVILITTKKGSASKPRLRLDVQMGSNWLRNPSKRFLMPNYYRDPSSGTVISDNPIQRYADAGKNIFRNGLNQQYTASLSGGNEGLRYYMSGHTGLNNGADPENFADKYGGRLNLTFSPIPSLDIQSGVGVHIDRIGLAPQAVDELGVIPSIMWGCPCDLNSPLDGFEIAPPDVLRRATNQSENSNRFIPSLTITHRPWSWLTQRLNFGVDFTDQQIVHFTPKLDAHDAQFFGPGTANGTREVDREDDIYTTLDYGATATAQVNDNLQSKTSVGLQIYAKHLEYTTANGQNFPNAGVKVVAGAGLQKGTDNYLQNNTVGGFVQEQLGWKDRLFLTGAVRGDKNSAFGSGYNLAYYPKASLSWVVSEEPWWNLGFVNSFKIRAAYGQSGQQPDAFAALRTFQPQSMPDGSSAITPQAVGNPDLGPERGKEIEAGFDASMFSDRVSVSLTYYNDHTTDAILQRNVAPSTGFGASQQYVNVGEVFNRGFEVDVHGQPINSSMVQWDMGVTLATNHNLITKLGIPGYLAMGWTGRNQQGYPVGSQWAHKVVSAQYDPNTQEAVNIQCQPTNGGTTDCLDGPRVYLGHPYPDVSGSFRTNVTLAGRLTLNGLVDFRVGQTKYVTEFWNRCVWRQVCRQNAYPSQYDPKILAAIQLGGADEFSWWLQKASFARLRELSLDYTLPERWAHRLGATSARVSIAANNLGYISNWPGIDPEAVNLQYANSLLEGQAAMPALQSLTARIDLVW
jgi:TonB-linked SusC/RagA family outer membrane protein